MIEENLKKQSDEILYKQFLFGDKEAFNELIIRYRKLLTNFIMHYIKNMDIAEDIAQDSFLYMIINKKEYDFKYSFKTYLYTIAKSRTLNYLKREKKKIYMDEIKYEDTLGEINIEDEVIKKYDEEKIKYVIKQLKREYQIIIDLYYFKNFKYREISKIMNISMSKTKMCIKRAKKKIEIILKEEI